MKGETVSDIEVLGNPAKLVPVGPTSTQDTKST